MINQSYLGISKKIQPLAIIDHFLNPFNQAIKYSLGDHEIMIALTKRAQQAMEELDQALLIEMQLYFSCMVKKRVLFHKKPSNDYSMVNNKLGITFTCVQSNECSPEEFADKQPEKRTLNSKASLNMHPKNLQIDYKNKEWVAEFSI